jgi:hypothetical protein
MNGSEGLLLVAVAAYFLPALVAGLRGVPDKGSVFVINLFLGWTVLGWVCSLAMACRSAASSTTSDGR